MQQMSLRCHSKLLTVSPVKKKKRRLIAAGEKEIDFLSHKSHFQLTAI